MQFLDAKTLELAKVCFLYYRRGLSQKDIADYIGKSIMAVSRMLKEARKRGIVEIQLKVPCPTNRNVEARLREQFPSVKEFIVFDNELLGEGNPKMSLGKESAFYIPFFLRDNLHVGIGAGETLSHLVDALPPQDNLEGIEVIQLTGILRQMASQGDATLITQRLTAKLGAKGYFFPLPNPFYRGQLKDGTEPLARICGEARSRWEKLDLAVVGIGAMEEAPGPARGGYISCEDLIDLRHKHAVGDVLLHFFDINGCIVDKNFDSSVTSISWEQLKAIPTVIAVAGGRNKVEAILGALNAGIINVLITDREAALAVLALAHKKRRLSELPPLGSQAYTSLSDEDSLTERG